MGKLILIRHGRTDLNRPGKQERLRAWKDIPLDSCGMQEAEDTARQLAGHRIHVIYSSDLLRARQTAEALQRVSGARIVHSSHLRPWNLGTLAGELVHDIIPILQRLNRQLNEKAPGGESFDEFYERYSRQIEEILAVAESSSGYVAAVTHGRNFMALPTILEKGDRSNIPVMSPVSTAGVYMVEKHASAWRIASNHANGSGHDSLPPQQAPTFIPTSS
jgi:probable phosphoglycerate mutase